MRKNALIAIPLSLIAAVGIADAAPIVRGQSVSASLVTYDASTVVASYVDQAFASQAPTGTSSTFRGTYSTFVYRDSSNNLCGVANACLTFVIRVTNSATSTDGIETVTTGPFVAGYSYDVGYGAVSGGIAPLYVADSLSDAVAFHFTDRADTANLIMPGQKSDDLVIRSSATQYRAGSISFQDSQTATVAGFLPAVPVPEPAGWAMMVAGIGAVGWSLRRRASAAVPTAG